MSNSASQREGGGRLDPQLQPPPLYSRSPVQATSQILMPEWACPSVKASSLGCFEWRVPIIRNVIFFQVLMCCESQSRQQASSGRNSKGQDKKMGRAPGVSYFFSGACKLRVFWLTFQNESDNNNTSYHNCFSNCKCGCHYVTLDYVPYTPPSYWPLTKWNTYKMP